MTARTQSRFAQIAGTSPSVTLNQTFDANGSRLSLSASIGGASDFVDNYTYDDLGRLSTLTQGVQSAHSVPLRGFCIVFALEEWVTLCYGDRQGTVSQEITVDGVPDTAELG